MGWLVIGVVVTLWVAGALGWVLARFGSPRIGDALEEDRQHKYWRVNVYNDGHSDLTPEVMMDEKFARQEGLVPWRPVELVPTDYPAGSRPIPAGKRHPFDVFKVVKDGNLTAPGKQYEQVVATPALATKMWVRLSARGVNPTPTETVSRWFSVARAQGEYVVACENPPALEGGATPSLLARAKDFFLLPGAIVNRYVADAKRLDARTRRSRASINQLGSRENARKQGEKSC